MKGVVDGGIDVPHSETRFFGYDTENKKYDAQAHRDRIFGKHVADYMKLLKEEDPDAYKRQFSQFIANNIEADDLEKMYKNAHEAIRRNPDHVTKPKKKSWKPVKYRLYKISLDERKFRIEEKKKLLLQLKAQEESA
ncbi:hypothetical protein OESDEN_17568 [Oesophagostomum dentatum]|uniref:Large ribosomal subunit protein uL18 n=1 Tax=Oesophagostomum dentatum TaxID=61180 RepID=A0A0B1SGT3_OESDE|nr:hypothetical protein OESDEN_25439 [Oesophagostomum dentatum]KHJ82737.1 hypothetical protein OESDEN_17568 [Oesophagostomum dentatum]